MPELHANQIRWEAPEPQKASFDKPNYMPLADAFTRLGAVADEIGQRQRDLLDDDLKADLKLAEDEANQIIENAASADADYDQLSEMMLSKVQGAFYKYDEATRTRFTRENKTYFDEIQLAVADKILQKKSKEIQAKVDVDIPLWASEAMVAPTEKERELKRNEGVAKIQTALQGLVSPDIITQKVYKFDNMIDKANLNNLITAGTEASYAEAKSFLSNPKKAASIDPYEWSVFNARIIAGEKELAKAKAKADDPLSLELIRTYAIYSGNGSTAAAQQLYRQVQQGGLIPYTVMGEGGKPVVRYIDTSKMPESQRLSIVTEMKKYNDLNPNFIKDQANYNASVNEALVLNAKATDNKDSDQDEALQLLMEYENDPLFGYLEKDTRTKIAGIVNEQIKARVEASLGENQQISIGGAAGWGIYSKTIGNPVTELSRMLIENKYRVSPEGGFVDWATRSPVNTLGDKYSPYENITLAVLGAANVWRERFATDMERNTVSEYGLFHKIMLQGYRDAGMLEDTRFNVSNRSIEEAFSKWSFGLKRNMQYNEKITDDNAKAVEDFYKILVGDNKLTGREKDVVEQMSKIVKTGQANRDFSGLRQMISTPEMKKSTKPVQGSRQQKNYQLMKAMNVVNTTTRTEKAAEELK